MRNYCISYVTQIRRESIVPYIDLDLVLFDLPSVCFCSYSSLPRCTVSLPTVSPLTVSHSAVSLPNTVPHYTVSLPNRLSLPSVFLDKPVISYLLSLLFFFLISLISFSSVTTSFYHCSSTFNFYIFYLFLFIFFYLFSLSYLPSFTLIYLPSFLFLPLTLLWIWHIEIFQLIFFLCSLR